MVKYQLACIGSTLCIYNQLLHATFLLVGYFYNVNPSIQQGVVYIIWFAEFVQVITYCSEQLHICQDFCPYTVNFLS